MPQALRQQPGARPLPDAATPGGARRGVDVEVWRNLGAPPRRDKLPEGLDAWWHAGVGMVGRAVPRRALLFRRARRIIAHSQTLRTLDTRAFNERVEQVRGVLLRGRERRADTDRALALTREAARRTLGLEPYPVQVAAALGGVLGCLIEMATGEGKTLTASMTAAIAGWRGRGCHVLTTNDYLARRDAQELHGYYAALGLRVASIDAEMEPDDRRSAYRADITYVTNKEVAADFLRDQLTLSRQRHTNALLIGSLNGQPGSPADRVLLRGLEQAIVDEADSILIDEGVTPLIISAEMHQPGRDPSDYQRADFMAEQLEPRHFRVDPRHRDVELTRPGRQRLAELCHGMEGIWKCPRPRHELVTRALTAEHLFHRDQHYVLQEGKVVIVDESTGRLMPDRTWRDGLHQAVEVKEGVALTPDKTTLARISFQRFFRRYRRLTGMTGTAREVTREVWQVYNLRTVRVPTHRPCIRCQAPDRVFPTADAKWSAVVDEILEAHRAGRPVLVGTASVEASDQVSRRLQALHLEHQVLSAIHHQREAEVVAQAGQRGTITVATNMAGRGTDIKLGQGVRELGGLYVIATERHVSGRIDRQLFGRAGRQGDPGAATVFVSLEDELIRRYAPRLRLPRLLRGAQTGDFRGRFRGAQRRAQRLAREQRKNVLQQDDWLREQLGFAGIEHA